MSLNMDPLAAAVKRYAAAAARDKDTRTGKSE